LDLETQVTSLQEEIRTAPVGRNASVVDWVPKGSARHTFSGHRSPITRVAFHPIFSLIATASEDSTIKIWDWETGEFERTLKGHTKEVKDVDFNARGTYLGTTKCSFSDAFRPSHCVFLVDAVSASSDLTIRLWEIEAWESAGYSGQSLYGHDHTISCARFVGNGDFIVSASRDKTIKIWEVATKYVPFHPLHFAPNLKTPNLKILSQDYTRA
jgi:platelet-activating factor acetylhydrolase IB subunit alpha